jgi:hypothetical protein
MPACHEVTNGRKPNATLVNLWEALKPEQQFAKAEEGEEVHVVSRVPYASEAEDLMG